MRTYVRVERGVHPARGSRRVLRLRRAARRPLPARPARHRRGRRRARRQLRGQTLRGGHGDGRAPGAGAVPAGRRGAAADVRLLRGEQGGVRGVPQHHAAGGRALDRRGVPRRRRLAADSGAAGRHRRAAAGRGAPPGRTAHHGRRRAHEVPRQGREWRRQARRAARRAARPRAGVPAPARRRAAVGRRQGHGRQAAGVRDRHGGRGGRSCPNRCSFPCSGARWAATCTLSPTTATRARSWSAAAGAPSGRSARSGAARTARRASTRWPSRWSTGSPAGCARPTASAARWCCACGSPTTPGSRARTRSPGPPRARRTCSRPCAPCWPGHRRSSTSAASRSSGIAVGNLDDDAVVQLELPFDEGSAFALDAALDSVHDKFGSAAVTRAVLLGRDQGFSVPLLPD